MINSFLFRKIIVNLSIVYENPLNQLLHVYFVRGHPPSGAEIEAIEKQCGGIPLKRLVTEGRDSFFSSYNVELPVLS